MKMKIKNNQITIWLVAILAFLIGLWFFLPKTVFSASAEETSSETVTVTLVDGYSNTIIGTKKVVVGEEFHFFTMTRPNYTFNGWMYNEELLTRADGVGIDVWEIAQDVTLEPDWIPDRKMIEFDTGCETLAVTAITIDYMTRTTLYSSEVMQRTGYIFAGWYDGEGGTGTQYATEDGNMVRDWDKEENPTTLYAKWDAVTYSIKFYAGNNDTLVRELSYTIETETIVLEDYEEDGKRFMGWFDNKSYETSSKIIEVPNGSIGDRNLYAWQKQLYTLSYKVNSRIVKTEEAIAGEIVRLHKYDKVGYTAVWTDERKANSEYIMPSNDVTLIAESWEPHMFTISLYDCEGASVSFEITVTVTYGQYYQLPTMPSGADRVFMGWYAKSGHNNADILPQQQRFTNSKGQSLEVWNYDYAIDLVAEYGEIEQALVNFYSRDNTYTITDSGRFNQGCDVINIKDYCGYSAKELYDVGYRALYITVQLDIWEKNYGYQHIFIYNGTESNAILLDHIEIEHGGTNKKTSADRYNFTFQVPLTATTLDIICVRYGASGNLEDNWCNKETVVLVDASTNENLQEASYYIIKTT